MSATSDEGVTSLEDQLRERDDKIVGLESQKEIQEEQILQLREDLASTEIKHKEEIYWMRLEVDNLRREKEALEDRVQQVYRDMREEDDDPPMMEPPNGQYDEAYIMGLQSQVGKYIRTLGILDHQIVMVKSSCDEVVKSLKEEIGDVMEEKCRMEMDLLNQLSVLDSEKRDLEIQFEQQMKFKNEQIAELKTSGNKGDTSASDKSKKEREEELLNEISDLKEAKKLLEDELEAERADADDAIARLEDANHDLEQAIETMNGDLETLREGVSTTEAVKVLDALARDRQDALTNLERVAMIWEKADDSIQGLEEIMDELLPQDDASIQGDRERLLSTLETASLVHRQVKVSLLLVELKLRNQLSSLKNDKLRMEAGELSADMDIGNRMKEIQQEALSALGLVEESLTDQIKKLEEAEHDDRRELEKTLQEKTDELKRIQAQHAALETEITKMRQDMRERQEEDLRQKENDEKRSSEDESLENGKAEVVVSKAVLERLQSEILTVVERVKEKNDTIGRLKTLVEEHKVREAALKKELRRIMRRSSTPASEEKNGSSGGSSGRRQTRRTSVVKTKL